MARVTVEDCLYAVDNRFELVLVAVKRARQIANGREPLVPWENDKPTVVALREVAEGYIDESIMQEREHNFDELLEMETAGLQEGFGDVPQSNYPQDPTAPDARSISGSD